jgi:hypothetical protein
MSEEAELHPIRRGCRGNRRLLPERPASYKVPTRFAFRTAAQLPRSPGAAPRLSGQVSASQRIRWRPAPQLVDAADLDHLLQPASKPSPSTGESEELNYRLLSSRPGATRKPSEKDCAISARVVPLIVLSIRWGHKILIEINGASHERRWAKAGKRCDG